MKKISGAKISEMRGVWENITDSIKNARGHEKRAMKILKKLGIGATVNPSKYAFGNGVLSKWRQGTVVGWSCDLYQVRIILHGNLTPQTYWCGFWERG